MHLGQEPAGLQFTADDAEREVAARACLRRAARY